LWFCLLWCIVVRQPCLENCSTSQYFKHSVLVFSIRFYAFDYQRDSRVMPCGFQLSFLVLPAFVKAIPWKLHLMGCSPCCDIFHFSVYALYFCFLLTFLCNMWGMHLFFLLSIIFNTVVWCELCLVWLLNHGN